MVMESAGVPVVRRTRGERRRGSIKSRIVELSKVRQSNTLIGPASTMFCSHWSKWFIVLLHQHSLPQRNSSRHPKPPTRGFGTKCPPSRGISCLSLVLYGIRAPRKLLYWQRDSLFGTFI